MLTVLQLYDFGLESAHMACIFQAMAFVKMCTEHIGLTSQA